MSRNITSKCIECDTEFSYQKYSSMGKYCSNKCQMEYQYTHVTKTRIIEGAVSERQTLRKYLIRERGCCCEICNRTTWEGVNIPLEIDHINGLANNNYPNNIRLVCPNCHALLPTSKGGNRGRGRKSLGIRLE